MDPFSMLTQIVNFVVLIQSAMKKASSNVKDCDTIEQVLGFLTDITKKLQGKPAGTLRDATKLLESTVSCASEIVDKCKHKGYLLRTWKADDISQDLARLSLNIQLILQTVNTAATFQLLADNVQFQADNADIKSMLCKILHILEANNPDVHRQKEVKELVPAQSHSTKCATSQIKKNEGKKKPKKSQVTSWPQVQSQENNRLGDSNQAIQASLSPKASSSVSKSVDEVQSSVAVSAAPFQLQQIINVSEVPGERGSYKLVISRLIKNMSAVTAIDVHPTKNWIATGHQGGYFTVWDYQKQKCVKEVKINEVPNKPSLLDKISPYFKETAPRHWVCSTKFIDQNKWLAVGDGRGYIYIYTYTDTKLCEIKKFKAHDISVDTLCVHPTEPYLLSSSAYGNKIKLWDWSRNWKQIREFDVKSAYPDGVRSLKFNPRDTNTFACVTDDKRVMVGDINSSSFTTRLKKAILDADYFFTCGQQQLMVTTSRSASPNCEIWDLETGKVVKTLDVSGLKMKLVAGDSTIPILVSASEDGTICYWDARTYSLLKMVKIPDSKPRDLVLVTGNGLTRLVAICETKIVIMEISLPTNYKHIDPS